MKNAGLEEKLFDKFLEMLELKGIHPQGGTLVDGTFVEVPRQHNTKAENAQLKKGEIPEEFKSNPHRLAQKKNHRLKSKVRCRIEHVFGEQKMRMKDETLRSIGFARAKFWMGMRNLNSNISRYLTLRKLGRVN